MKDVDQSLQQRVSDLLDESVDKLDHDTCMQLQLARGHVLQQNGRKARNRWYLATAFASVAIVLVAAVFTFHTPLERQPAGIGKTPDSLMSVEGPDETELYEDLEFYMWLSSKKWAS